MKKYILLIFLLVAIILPSHGQPIAPFNQNGIKVQVLDFKELNDELHITYSINMDARSVARYQGINIILGVETPTDLLLLPSFTVLGNNKRNVLVRYYNNNRLDTPAFDIEWLNDHSFIFRVTVPYQMWFDDAQLSVRQEIQGYRASTMFTHYYLGARVELEPREPYQVQPQTAMGTPERVEKALTLNGQSFLDFQVGRSVILPNFRRNPEELRQISEMVSSVVNDPDAQLQSIFIEGFASPEGPWESNNRLARARSYALRDHIRNQHRLSDSDFRVTWVAEDWDGLVALLQESTMPHRDEVLHIINTVGVFAGRETALMNLAGGVPWRTMLRDMFPQLRRVEYQINYVVRDFGVQDAARIMEIRPENLSHLEMFQVAEAAGKGSERFNQIVLDIILRHFPDDETANLNAAAVLLENGEVAAARRHLDRAGTGAATLNNRGVAALLEGDLDTAYNYFVQAQQAGSPYAEHNRNEVELKREDNVKMERFR